MRFFTPELYIRFNSQDDEEADRADEAWEEAIQEYRRHLDGLRDRMSSPVKKLAELSLHDAELLACDELSGPFPFRPRFEPFPFEPFPYWLGLAIVSVKQDRNIVSLIYTLSDHITRYPPRNAWPFSKARMHWLYDELDLIAGRRETFVHRVLFSNGEVIEIPFVSVLIHSFPLPAADEAGGSRQGVAAR
jgi:hypothetical protein